MALTIRQPWAWAIAAAGKDVENRSWHTGYRGPLAVHAGLANDGAVVLRPRWRGLYEASWGHGDPAAAHGAVIAVAQLAGCHLHDPGGSGCGHDGRWEVRADDRCSDWAFPREWHWQLRDVRPLAEPVSCTGRLGLWRLPPAAAAAVAAQLAADASDDRS
jgi:hypothetical protein